MKCRLIAIFTVLFLYQSSILHKLHGKLMVNWKLQLMAITFNTKMAVRFYGLAIPVGVCFSN